MPRGNDFEETIMSKVRRPIDPRDFTRIPSFREIIKTLPKELRFCSRHGEEVTIQESEFVSNPAFGAPFVDAADKARAAGHAGALFFLRVGSPYAHRLMTPHLNKT